jgi:hypothetical protein
VRDIRDDLIERLEKANAEMAVAQTNHDVERRELEQRFHRQFVAIAERQKALRVLLDEETGVLGEKREVTPGEKRFQLPLQEFILNLLSANGSATKDEIKDAAERAGYESAGRMVHATLLNIKKSDKVLLLADGQYQVRVHDFSKKLNLGQRPSHLQNFRVTHISPGVERNFHESEFQEPTEAVDIDDAF